MNRVIFNLNKLRGTENNQMDTEYYRTYFDLYLTLCLRMNRNQLLYPVRRLLISVPIIELI